MAISEASAELHPPADESGDTNEAPIEDAPPKRNRAGRPRLEAANPLVEARRAADRERKRLARLNPKPPREPKPEPMTVNEAVAAVEAGVKKKASRSRSIETPVSRPRGWIRKLIEESGDGAVRTVAQIRYLAQMILERDGLAWAQECLADPSAKDSDKARASDLLAKLSAGYVTPDMAAGEDAPELPAPIFQFTDGELPGESMAAMLSEEDGGSEDDAGGPQLASSIAPAGSAPSPGPIPYTGAA